MHGCASERKESKVGGTLDGGISMQDDGELKEDEQRELDNYESKSVRD